MSNNKKIKDYNLLKVIGKGSFGEVHLTVKDNNPKLFAAKSLDLPIFKDPIKLKYLKNEINFMKQLNHPNIIRFIECFSTSNHYYIIMEYCNGGSLRNMLKKYKKKYRKPFPIKIIQYFALQILEAIKYIHSKQIVHRDIKLDNILIHFNNISGKMKKVNIDIDDIDDDDLLNSMIKITDFGLSTKLEPGKLAKTVLGTLNNMDPIILENYKNGQKIIVQGYDEKADIWSLGTIFYEMLTGEPMFNPEKIMEQLKEGKYSIPIDIEVYDEILSFLQSMLQYKGNMRLSAEELLNHPFIKKDVKDFIKVDSYKNPEKLDISYINFNDKGNPGVINIEDIKSKELYQNYIDNLLVEYKAVSQYFKENGLLEQEKDANEKCFKIEEIKKELNSKNKLFLSNMPMPINPEYIYGCSIKERNKKFKEVLYRYKADKDLLGLKIKTFQKQSKGGNNKDEFEKNKKNYDKLNNEYEYFDKKYKNIWTPAPKYTKVTQKNTCEKISFDKCSFKVKIRIKKIDNKKEKLDIIISFLINEERKHKKNVKLKPEEKNYEEWIWELSADEWVNIDNNLDNFILGIETGKSIWNNNIDEKIYIDISKIKSGKGITFDQQIKGANYQKINISIFPLMPEGIKSYIIEEKVILNIEKDYPPFEFKLSKINNNPRPSQKEISFKQ